MAAVHNRLRSSSDPFVDPTSYSAISTKTSARSQHRPPAPPPKSSRMLATVSKQPAAALPREQVTEAIRDTVTVRHVDQSSRAKPPRSQTALSPTSININTRSNINSGRRSHSQDSVTTPSEKNKSAGKNRPKKGSQHADVIDRLDFTGVGPMFHHDGPFDACAPSRNRHIAKAPMLAWSSDGTSSQIPNPETDTYEYYEPPKKKVDAIAEAWGIHEPEPFEEFSAGGNSRLDTDTPTSSIYAGREGHGSRSGTNGKRKDSRDFREYYRDQQGDDSLQMGGRHSANRRSVIPPPQPVFVPDSQSDIDVPLGSPSSGYSRSDGPRRSKSILQRIRKIRDAPNVPMSDDIMPSSPTAAENLPTATSTGLSVNTARPTHRSQHSFLGRFAGGRTSMQRENIPSSPESPEAFVYIEDSRNQNKELPPPPTGSPPGDEIEVPHGSASGPQSPGRRGSLLRRVRDVVIGTK